MKNSISAEIINRLIEDYPSMREFARTVGEAPADLHRWKNGVSPVSARAVVNICRIHKDVLPWQLNHSVFPENLRFTFLRGRKDVD